MPNRIRPRKRSSERKAAPARLKRWIPIAAIAVIAVAAALILIFTANAAPRFAGVPQADRTSMGSPDAPVLVEEYSDFQCPYCALFFREQEPELIEKYIATGKVRLTYIPFSFIGPESLSAAEAAYCAADQNKFWDYHYLLFTNQGAENSGKFADARLISYAGQAGLDMPAFRQCFSNNTYQKRVEDDNLKGDQKGVTGTPTFFVNGKGPIDSTRLFTEIEAALQQP